MAWPFDADGENPIISGLLAGRRFSLLEEELKSARLQRAELEATSGHRELLRTLEEQRRQSDVNRSKLEEDLSRLQIEQASFALQSNREDRPVERQLRRTQLRAARTSTARGEFELGEARSNAPLVREGLESDIKASQARQRVSEGQLAESNVDLLSKKLNLAAGVGRSAGKDVGLTDIASLVNTLGVKDDSAKSLMTMMIKGEVDQAQREIDEHRSVLAGRELEQANALAETAAVAAERGPGYVSALGEVLGYDNPIVIAAQRTLEGGGLKSSRIDPFTLEIGKAEIGEIFAQRRDIQKQMSEKEQQLKVARSKNRRDDIDRFSSELNDLRLALEELKKKTKVGSEKEGERLAVPRVKNADDYARLPKGSRYIDPSGKERVKP